MERKIMKTCWKLIAMFAVAMLLVLGGTVRPEMAAEAKAEEIELSSVADSFWNLESGNYKVTSDYISDSNISLNYNAVVTIRVPSGVTLTVPQLSMKEGGSLTLTGGGSIVINGNNPGQGGIGNSASLSIDGVSITVTDSTYSIYQNSYATKTEIKNATITGEDIILSKNKGLTVEGSTIPGIRGEAFGNESDQTITITDSKVTDEIYWLNNTALTIDHSQVGKITAYGDQSRTVIQNGSVITGLVSGPGTKTITGSTIRGGSVKDSTVTNSTFTGTSTISGTSSLAGNSTVNGSVTIPSGSSLTVQKGAKLTVAAGASLTNNGTLINNGRIVNGGTVDNQGAYNGAEPEITGGGINAGFSHEYYSVIVNQAKNGTVSANMTSASVNSLVTLTVTPADNYVLNTLTVITGTGAQVTVENNTFRMPRASVTVTATFRPKDYSIATASMSHGNVTVQATARYGDTVPVTVIPDTGYVLSSLTVMRGNTAVAVTNNTFVMPAGNVTVSAAFAPDPKDFKLTGVNEYTILTETGWNVFCDCLEDNDTWNRFSGMTVKLGANISVSRMAGSSKHDFCGIFDGNYHTLTFNYGTADAHSTDSYVAPFSYVSNTKANPSDTNDTPVVIRNLRVCGDIYTSGQQAGGIIAREWGTVSITNCRVSINIHSSTVGDGTHGGLVACINNGSLTIEGCVFDGSLLGNSTDSCGGFIGWRAGSAVIRNSLFTPDNVTVLSSGSATFARNKVDTYNSYYTSLLNDGTNYAPFLADATVSPAKWNNGMASLTVTTEDEYVTTCTVSPVGDNSQTYSVSGITAYDNGIVRGETFYYGQGDNVNITLSAAEREGYACTGFTASAGTMSGGSSPYTLTMPDADVTVSANYISYWAELQAMINDSDGTGDSPTTIKLTQDYTATSTDTALQIPSGKYIVLDLDGHTIDRGLTSAKADGNVFTVEGNLTVTDSSENQSGAIKGGNNTGNGGGVVVNGGTFNLNGGSVSGNDGGFSGGGVYISSGTFNMTGGTISGNTAGYNGGGVYSTGRLRVSGTPVITGNVKGGTIVNGQLTGGTTQNVYMPGSYGIVVTGALTDTASIGVTMENPGVFADYDRNYTLTDSDLARFTSDNDDYCIRMNDDHRGVLRACYAISIAAAEHGTVTASVNGESATKAAEGDTVTLTVTPTEDFVLAANGLRVSWTDEDNAEYDVAATQGTGNDADKWSFEMPDHNVTVSAVFIPSTFGKPDFTLPAQLTTIEESAFEGDTLITVVDASNCSSIGAYAFKDTGLTQIRLDKDCEIAENAFSGCGTVYVFVQAGGKTKTFCDTHEGIEFVAIDSID